MWEQRVDEKLPVADDFAIQWFENRLSEVRMNVEQLFETFRLSEALKTIYSLVWDDFCSWYLEWVKPGFEQPISAAVYRKTVSFFTELLQLLHPYMPFITEEVYHLLEERNEDLCALQFTAVTAVNRAILDEGELLKQVITALRDARVKHQLKPKDEIALHIQSSTPEKYKPIAVILGRQVNASSINISDTAETGNISLVVGQDRLYVQSAVLTDSTAQKEQLQKDLSYQRGFLQSIEKKLSNERFVQNAKPEVVELERKKQADAEAKIKAIEESLAQLG